MRKLLAATAVALSLTAPAQAQWFQGSGPGWGQGGGWNACSNCGMRGPGYYSQWAGATNGFGRGMLGWGGIPSANGYGMGWGGNALVGQTLGQFMGGGMFGGMGPLGMLGGLFGGNGIYPGAIIQQPGYPPPNGYAYGATRYGGGGAIPQYLQGGGPVYGRGDGTYQGNPGPGYPYAARPQVRYQQVVPQQNGLGAIDRSIFQQATPRGAVAYPVYVQQNNMEPRGTIPAKKCRMVKIYTHEAGFVYKDVCVPG